MRKYIPYLIILALLIWGIHNCERKNYFKDVGDANAAALTDTTAYFTNRQGTETATIKTLHLDKKGMQALLFDKDKELDALRKEFSSVHYVAKFGSAAKFDSIGVKFDTPIHLPAGDTTGRFERTGSVRAKWYALGYKVNNDSLHIAPFETWTETTVLTGTKRKWIFGKEILTTDITNSNPHIKITGITSAELTIATPWYKKWWVWFLGGLAAGGILLK